MDASILENTNSRAGNKAAEDFRSLSDEFVGLATRGLTRVEFLKEVTKALLDFSQCNVVQLSIKLTGKQQDCEVARRTRKSFKSQIVQCILTGNGNDVCQTWDNPRLGRLCRNLVIGKFDPSLRFFTLKGSFWTKSSRDLLDFFSTTEARPDLDKLREGNYYNSLALIPLRAGDRIVGLMQLKSHRVSLFSRYEIESYEEVAQTLGVVLLNQRTQAALRERVKELTCLYGIAKVAERPGITLDDILQGIAELLPPGWQYPEITCGKIVLDGVTYTTQKFSEGRQKQRADIVVGGITRGFVQVTYTRKMPELDEGPFLREERNLIDAVARQISLIVERRQAAEEKVKLEEQLRHADRLATIGQLSAGVAHEINEPLGNILGFAQLAGKCPKLPEQAEQDIDRIIAASLHAREIIKKLMLFGRQLPPQKAKVNLNELIHEGLYFLESRCAKEGIELVRSLSRNLPEITADPAQLHQVLINLVVNAIQAMPEGGVLTIKTCAEKDHVVLTVQDTGIGMEEEVREQLFLPFFTTKDVGEGTGIGLSVVHGIVTSHGGSIEVESEVGKGSVFRVGLPVSERGVSKEIGRNGATRSKRASPGRR